MVATTFAALGAFGLAYADWPVEDRIEVINQEVPDLNITVDSLTQDTDNTANLLILAAQEGDYNLVEWLLSKIAYSCDTLQNAYDAAQTAEVQNLLGSRLCGGIGEATTASAA